MGNDPFAAVPPDEWIASNGSAFAIWDRFPVSAGHALVVPHRTIPTWWEATSTERADMFGLVDQVKSRIDADRAPSGYNVGFNAGAAAGQTVGRLHVHVIPRYEGDVSDPRGGIRHVIPGRGNYLASAPLDHFRLIDGIEGSLSLELLRCLINPRFNRADLVVSFIMRSGLGQIDRHLEAALDRGCAVRILTTDYLHVTDADALARLLDLADRDDDRFQIRVFSDESTSFHPKAYLFWSSDGLAASAFVGSSNLSGSGIAGGVEWNLGVDRVAPMLTSFERLWNDPRSLPLTAEWLRHYRQAVRPAPVVPIEVEIELPAQPAEPRMVQEEALDALERTRTDGFKAGLVVMATGLGKTWLAAFDTARPQFRRILFVAHREEILRQSRDVFRRVQPDGDFGLFMGGERSPDARVVFAGVQTIVRHLRTFPPDAFDYVVVDEFHHAAAASYRRVINHFSPEFLLGLTATPERMDGAELLALCGENLVYECDLFDGIRRGQLATFDYWGVADSVDFTPIPWRNGRFDPAALAQAVETRDRAQQAFDEWSRRRGTRTLAFCVSVTHADFMSEFFAARGVACAAVHSGPTSAPRCPSVDQLRSGALEVIFTVDLFNEGLDVPEIDTVLMLRPTGSPVVFLQQLGRGLRRTESKERLTIVDFIGNHRSFLLKPRTLLGMGSAQVPSTARVLEAMATGEFHLPPSCSVRYDLTVVEFFSRLERVSARFGLEEFCRSYAAEEGMRARAVQAYRSGYNPAAARPRHQGWFGMLDDLGLLEPEASRVVAAAGDVLLGLETEPLTKSYKLVTLQVLLRDGALRSGATLRRIAAVARELLLADPRLVRDAANREFPDLAATSEGRFGAYWRRWPIAAWIGELRGDQGRWFRLDGDQLVPTFHVDEELGECFDDLVAELVEYRLARYLDALAQEGVSLCKVDHAGGRPFIRLDRRRYPGLPEGEASFVADGQEYTGRFMKVALNVATLPGVPGNALHALLRGWFGGSAGHPGTHHQVAFSEEAGHLVLRKSGPAPIEREQAAP